MIGTKYLSEAIHQDEIKPYCLNLIRAPVGCGKTYWALNTLAASLEDKTKMLYLIDTVNGRDQLLFHNPITKYYDSLWRNDVLRGTDWFGDTKVVVMTYAKFGSIVIDYPSFGDSFRYILCDEIHSLPRFCAFTNGEPSARQLHPMAWNRLIQLINNSKVVIIGLSATPNCILSYDSFQTNEITIDKDIRQYETCETIRYSNLDLLLPQMSKDAKTLLYVSRITEMERIVLETMHLGFNPIAIWSIHNPDHPMTDKQYSARNYILNNSRLPDEYNLVLINASCETSINLYGQIDNIIINTKEEEAQVQVRGRYRNDLKTLYLLDNSIFPEVPPAFLNRELFAEDKKKLAETLKLKSAQGKNLGWPSVKKALLDNGYSVIEGRFQNRRFEIINKA